VEQAGLTILVGFASGVMSGMFGVGGGVITTPAIRWVLGAPALVAVGTPLPVILPSALTGAISYRRHGLADLRGGLTIGLVGSAFSVLGAILATKVGGQVVLLLTGLVIVYMSADMVLQVVRPRADGEWVGGAATDQDADAGASAAADPALVPDQVAAAGASPVAPRSGGLALAFIGALTGLYSGFLGLGGGFILVPILTRWFRYPIKMAIGTSLVAITVLSIPGSITHYLLGNVDPELALLLIVGVVPGALVGSRITFGASDRFMRLGFAALLVVVGVALLITESGVLG